MSDQTVEEIYKIRYVQMDSDGQHYEIYDSRTGEVRSSRRLPEGWALALAHSYNLEATLEAFRKDYSYYRTLHHENHRIATEKNDFNSTCDQCSELEDKEARWKAHSEAMDKSMDAYLQMPDKIKSLEEQVDYWTTLETRTRKERDAYSAEVGWLRGELVRAKACILHFLAYFRSGNCCAVERATILARSEAVTEARKFLKEDYAE